MREFVSSDRFEAVARGSLLVPVSLAAAVRGISRQRVYARMEAGSVRVVVACGGFVLVDLETLAKRAESPEMGPAQAIAGVLRTIADK